MVWRLTPAARASSAAAMPRRLRSLESRLSTRDAGVVLSLKSDIVVYTLPLPDSRFSPRLRPDGVGAGGTRRALRHGRVRQHHAGRRSQSLRACPEGKVLRGTRLR